MGNCLFERIYGYVTLFGMTDLTPMLKQYRKIKEQHRDTFLFFRMGDFYEMFYDDAVEGSKILDITLTSRGKGTPNNIPMCGVPYHSADNYIAKLVKSGHKVAICEQVEDPKLAMGIVKREVIRVITPGTISDPSLLDAKSNNYIASLSPCENLFGLALIDLSTGIFKVTEIPSQDYPGVFLEYMKHFAPKELVLPEHLSFPDKFKKEHLTSLLLTPIEDWHFSYDMAKKTLLEHFQVTSLEGYGCADKVAGLSAGGALIHYLKQTQKAELSHISKMSWHNPSDYMILDYTTQKNLEIVHSLIDRSRTGTLLSVIDQTLTPMGGRTLRSFILNPLLSKKEIDERLDAVSELCDKTMERQEIRNHLKSIQDIERILSKITLETVNPRDMIALKNSFYELPRIKVFSQEFLSPLLSTCLREMDPLEDIYQRIDSSLLDQPPLSTREGGIFKDGFHTELDALRKIRRTGKDFIASLETKERKRTGINSLKVRYNKVFGYYIEVSKPNLPHIADDYIRKQTLVNAERFITPELKEYESKVLNAQENIKELESKLFEELRHFFSSRIPRMRETAENIAVIDVMVSFAEAAAANSYTRPIITEGHTIRISNGRHPVVEKMKLDGRFVPNDTLLDDAENQILIITGPNMGGKSTYLRQVALITLLAQAGSFVPADHAEIGTVDRIFTRVGASDSLVEGKSTFLTEMSETANILNNATPRSLLILDEIGRGTATFDGLSIAWATLEYIHENATISAKTLFATHYHELTELAVTLPRVANYNIAAKEWMDEVIFLHKLQQGKADRSYGIQVAKLAGIPKKVIERAKEILTNLERNEFGKDGIPKLAVGSKGASPKRSHQLPLFTQTENGEIVKEIEKLKLDELKPLDALNVLDRLKKKIKEND
jgi:DNA mismatch repair protein MutS